MTTFSKIMQAEKLSISLPKSLIRLIENYKIIKGCKSRSQVIEVALELLRDQELEEAYQEASVEVDPAWEVTVADGLTDETWWKRPRRETTRLPSTS